MKKIVAFKKGELVELYNKLCRVTEKFNKNFTYAIAATKKAISAEAEALIEGMAPSDSYLEYEKARAEIINKYALKDESGNLITKKGGIKISPENVEECQKAIEENEKVYTTVLEERERDYINFDKTLEEIISIEVETIAWEFVPETIDQSFMEVLLKIIER